ncbi:kinase-like protein [Daldinia bambusicola]|nr:kinase-like protein [Daldinia bambusicola]
MKSERGQVNNDILPIASTKTWNTFLSRTSVSSLSSAAFSNPHLTGRANGLDEVLSTVKALSLRRIPYEEIERQDVVGEGETFIVERCVVWNQTLAIKHLKTNMSPDDRAFRGRIQSTILELRIMRHAPLRSHPNIITVLGYGWSTGISKIAPYLLVQYAPYGTFRQYLQHTKPGTSITQKEILIGDVAAAASALHLCGIIHGDIKLDNVLIFHSWDRPAKSIAKISDFGHSLVVTGKEDSERYLRYSGTFMLALFLPFILYKFRLIGS